MRVREVEDYKSRNILSRQKWAGTTSGGSWGAHCDQCVCAEGAQAELKQSSSRAQAELSTEQGKQSAQVSFLITFRMKFRQLSCKFLALLPK